MLTVPRRDRVKKLPVGVSVVANFRLYRLDGAGKIATAEWIEAADDDGAAEHARGLGLDCTCEVWDRQRLVARVEPSEDRPAGRPVSRPSATL